MQWKKYNLSLIVLPIFIFSLGFVSLLSVSPDRAKDQFGYFLIGILLYVLFSIINYKYLIRFWKQIYIANLVLLFLTFMLGHTAGGSIRWFSIAGFSFQPSEFAKISLILALTALLSQRENFAGTVKGLFHAFLLFLPFFIFVLIQPDLGTSLVLGISFIGILFCFGINKYLFFFALFLFGLISDPLWSLLKDYQKNRILVFLNPQLDTLGAGYNVVQALIAIGSGGFLGKGLGRGSQSHLEFLPAYWTDFVFASFAEEWGFLGVILFLSLFTALLGSILYVLYKTKDLAGRILLVGFFIVFFSQFIINVGMNMGIMPVTGIPLPLMTYGGSSLIVHLIMLGLIQNVWLHNVIEK
jgi:rod shape determining protein RodA